MKIKNLKKLSFEELKLNFLAGQYDQNLDEHHEAMRELHNKLPNMEGLIPLLISKNRNCEYTAAFIAAQEGDNACSIFSYLFALLESPWKEVRDEVCDCFLNCTTDASHYISLFDHLDDNYESIRLRVITIICGINNGVIKGVYEKLHSTDKDATLLEAFALLNRQASDGLTLEDIEERIIKGNKLDNVFAYIATYKEFGENEQLLAVSELTNEAVIKKHYKIYFCDDDESQ